MTKQQFTERFNQEFDKDAFKNAYGKLSNIVNAPSSYDYMLRLTDAHDEDDEHSEDKEMSFYCEMELDRNRMSTDADYVSAEFRVAYDIESKKGEIIDAAIYLRFPDGDGGRMCFVDPATGDLLPNEGIDWDIALRF